MFNESCGHIPILDKLDKNDGNFMWIPVTLYCLGVSVFVLETDCLLCDVLALGDETAFIAESAFSLRHKLRSKK